MPSNGLHALFAAAQLIKPQRDASRALHKQADKRRTSVRISNQHTQQKKTARKHSPAPPVCLQQPAKHPKKKTVDKLLGRKVRKQFFNARNRLQWYDGEVASVSRAAKAGFFYRFGNRVTASVKYFVKYPADNDSEHMTKWQIKHHLVKVR
jgi:hypothetical protein